VPFVVHDFPSDVKLINYAKGSILSNVGQHLYKESRSFAALGEDWVHSLRNCYNNYWGGYVFLLFQVF
jgi:hypothetical protein